MVKFQMDERKGTMIGKEVYEREVKLFASPNSTISTDGFALGMTIIESGQKHEVHNHEENNEVMVVYEGSGLAYIDGVEVNIQKGDVIGIEINESHGFANTGDQDLKLLWIYHPTGIAEEKFLIR